MNRNSILMLITLVALLVAFVPVTHADDTQPVFTIIGMAFQDRNLDGAWGLSAAGSEPGLGNVTVHLYLDNAPLGVLGAEDKVLEVQPTNSEGYVVFNNVTQGTYLLQAARIDNQVATTPTMQALTLAGQARGAALEWVFGFAPRSDMPVRAFLPAVGR